MPPVVSLRKLRQHLGRDLTELVALADEAPKHYQPFDIYKGLRKDGTEKWRHIDNPDRELKDVQTLLQKKILRPVALGLPDYMTGGLPGRSIIDNAWPHLGQPAIVALDIESCFPNISHKMVFSAWRQGLGFSTDVASLLTKLTTLQNRLPQGAPTSPVLCNLVLQNVAAQIFELASASGCNFTLYIDDITLSGPRKETAALIEPIIRLLGGHNLAVSRDKISIMDSNEIQKVTGVKVNQSLKVTREKNEQIRAFILAVAAKGCAATKHEVNAMWGMIHFVKSVDPRMAERLQQLALATCADIVGLVGPKDVDRRRSCKKFSNQH
jgi:RNA-directed DNA polymerase